MVNWWDFINREPHHRLESEKVIKPVWLSNRVDTRAVEYVAKHPETWKRLRCGHKLESTSLAKYLSSESSCHFPTVIQLDERRISYDTQENRMIKHILQELHEITLEMNRRLARKLFFSHLHITRDNLEMQRTLEEMLDTAWLTNVGDLQYIPASSTVLQNKYGYRQWYSFYQQSLLGSNYPLPHQDLIAMIEGRNIATLFEYWCYFSIIDVIREISGYRPITFKREINEDGIHVLRDGLKVTFLIRQEKLDVYFNKTFVGQSTGRVGSYSQSYRPDISLHWRNHWYHFDAKFKYSVSSDEDGCSRFVKKEDIDKMHTYKDAIIGTRSAWVLFPSEVEGSYEFYSDPQDQSRRSGIGAIGVLPGNMKEITNVVKEILELA